MTVKHTMTLTDDQAHLLHRWAKKELESPTAVAAAWVLKGLIDAHILEWAQNKWNQDQGQSENITTYEHNHKPTKVMRAEGEIQLWSGGPRISSADFVAIWNFADNRLAALKAIRKCIRTDEVDDWIERVGEQGAIQRMSLFAGRCRIAGMDVKKMKRGRRKPQVDDSARSTRT
jgi:hypothetical protein